MSSSDQTEIDEFIYKIEESKKQSQVIETAIIVIFNIMFILYVAAVAHSAVRLCKTTEAKKTLRIGFLLIAVIFGPLYWLIYPIAYAVGAFKK